MFLPSSEDRETAIYTLRALAAMGMKLRHTVDADAAPRVSDQIAAPVCRYPLDDFRLRSPTERIVYVKGATENLGKHATKARQDLWVSGSGCSSADDLGNRWQVQAHHAVLEKTDAVSVE